ncbi:hypothetical protein [Pseudomonas fluorescens]|uniref:hypothetical protein n=1 Tax=Pseudomonas fluorescens TaxID=294 RepID=UPI0038087219
MKIISPLIAVAVFAACAFATTSNQNSRFFTQVTGQHQAVASDGPGRPPKDQTQAENARNRPEDWGLVQDGFERTPLGEALVSDGSDHASGRRLS